MLTKQGKAKLQRVKQRANNLPWGIVGNIMKASIQKSFELGGRYSTERSFKGGERRWKKRKDKKSHKVLILKGNLKNKIKYTPSSNSLEIRSSMPYSAAQHYGYPKRNLASRPIITIQTEDIKEIGKEFKKHIAG